jgi:hypothetical protein
MSEEAQLVTVCIARQLEAHVIKGRLESEGIPVLLSYESAGLVYGITVDGIGEVRVMVPESMETEARKILEASDKAGDVEPG